MKRSVTLQSSSAPRLGETRLRDLPALVPPSFARTTSDQTARHSSLQHHRRRVAKVLLQLIPSQLDKRGLAARRIVRVKQPEFLRARIVAYQRISMVVANVRVYDRFLRRQHNR